MQRAGGGRDSGTTPKAEANGDTKADGDSKALDAAAGVRHEETAQVLPSDLQLQVH